MSRPNKIVICLALALMFSVLSVSWVGVSEENQRFGELWYMAISIFWFVIAVYECIRLIMEE